MIVRGRQGHSIVEVVRRYVIEGYERTAYWAKEAHMVSSMSVCTYVAALNMECIRFDD